MFNASGELLVPSHLYLAEDEKKNPKPFLEMKQGRKTLSKSGQWLQSNGELDELDSEDEAPGNLDGGRREFRREKAWLDATLGGVSSKSHGS